MRSTRVSEEAVVLACVAFLGEATLEEAQRISGKMYNALCAVDEFDETHLILDPDVGDTIVVLTAHTGVDYQFKAVWDGSYWGSYTEKFAPSDLERILVNYSTYKKVDQEGRFFKKVNENED